MLKTAPECLTQLSAELYFLKSINLHASFTRKSICMPKWLVARQLWVVFFPFSLIWEITLFYSVLFTVFFFSIAIILWPHNFIKHCIVGEVNPLTP